MSKIVHKLDTCTGMIVRVDVDGRHVDLSFRSHTPDEKEIASAIVSLEQRLKDEQVAQAVADLQLPGKSLPIASAVEAVEKMCTVIAERWKTEATQDKALADRVQKIVSVTTVKAG